MKTELVREMFHTSKKLVEFVNENKISKENIQSITTIADMYILFYWEITQ